MPTKIFLKTASGVNSSIVRLASEKSFYLHRQEDQLNSWSEVFILEQNILEVMVFYGLTRIGSKLCREKKEKKKLKRMPKYFWVKSVKLPNEPFQRPSHQQWSGFIPSFLIAKELWYLYYSWIYIINSTGPAGRERWELLMMVSGSLIWFDL